MNRRLLLQNLLAVSAGALVIGKGRAQDPLANVNEDPFILRSESRLVLLDVSVRNRQGAVVSGLSRDDFRIWEDGQRQTIATFDRGDLPVTLGVLIDESRSMAPKRDEVLAAAESLIAESNTDDEIFVVNFNETATFGLSPSSKLFSDSLEELRAALYRGVPRGRTALNDAVIAGLERLELGKRERKTLVVISDGGDNNSDHSARETIDHVERSLATIYAIGLLSSDDRDRNPGFLRRLARASGGEAFFPSGASQMAMICHRIAQDIRSRYTLGYVPSEGKRTLRRVRVEVRAEGLRGLSARTRSVYRFDR